MHFVIVINMCIYINEYNAANAPSSINAAEIRY